MAVSIPYVGSIDGGLSPGKMVRIQGSSPATANRFAINIQTGPGMHPRDDIVLHVSAIFSENVLSRASLQAGVWGTEERTGTLPFGRGQPFEMLILCDTSTYKIAINSQHFTDFVHRVPFHLATHLVIEGDIDVSNLIWEGGSGTPQGFVPPTPTSGGMYPPLGGVGGVPPYPSNPASIPPYSGAQYVPPPPPGAYGAQPGYGPPPPAYGAPQPYAPSAGYGAPGYAPGYAPPQQGYGQQPPYGQPGYGQPGYGQPGYGQPGYPPPPPGYSNSTSNDPMGFLSKAGTALMGALGTAGVLGAIKGSSSGDPSHHKTGGGGVLDKVGTALGLGAGAAVLGSVLKGKSHHGGYPGYPGGGHGGGGMLGKKKSHKKAKKAAKYGLPVAGLGLGAYALHKGVKGFHGSSSSSSSSSEEE
ncbi:hypothetical protein B566_EDAN009341 [Ephemera danica]|nr:hypothetical protein B566_EDAN009341 [Ephemera danica]